jgi:hypothetical protein
LALTLLLAGQQSLEAQAPEKKPVQFPKGQTGVTLEGTIKGRQVIDYTLRAAAGQVMAVTFKPSNASAYFNVLPPGSTGEAIFIGSTSGNEYSAGLPASGEYTIRVYLMGNAARRNEAASYQLEVRVTGAAKKPGPETPGNVGPTKWDASGSVTCSVDRDTFDRQCGFRVVRDLAKQSADIWVGNVANGEADYRFLHYGNKAFTTNDNAKVAWQRKDDNWSVSVNGKEFYLIPDALVHGG